MLVPTINDFVTNLTSVALNLARSNYDARKPTAVSFWSSAGEPVVAGFLRGYPNAVLTTDLRRNRTIDADQFVFITESSQDYDLIFRAVNWTRVQPVAVVLVLLAPAPRAALRPLAAAGWRHNVTDLFIVHRSSCGGEVQISTYLPFSGGRCDNVEPVTLSYSDAPVIFPRKFKNFHKCPLRVSFVENLGNVVVVRRKNGGIQVRGTEGLLARLLAARLNASLVPVFPRDGGEYGGAAGGRWTGSVGDVVHGRADVSAASALLNLERYRATQPTHSYKVATVVWVGPPPRELQAWAKVLIPLYNGTSMWLLLASAAFYLVSVAIHILQDPEHTARNNTLLHSVAIFLGQNVRFETKFWLLNSLFAMWLWFCVIVAIFFQGELVKGLQQSILEPGMTTFEEAVKEVNGYGGIASLLNFYEDDEEFKARYQQISVKSTGAKLQAISRGERFLFATDARAARTSRLALQRLAGAVARAPVPLLARARWPGARELDALLLRVLEAGFFEKIEDDSEDQITLKYFYHRRGGARRFNALDLYHVSGCFYIYIIMVCVCTAVFVIEIIWFRFSEKRKIMC
ncbi:uncharacterized protein LOC119691497 [Plutella xylostella]|uniref:uncharacterized protein LOC119691497 n=1 Tax=Plutella xylostella TaxID=51655 RepID=UPI0020329193|nr:uncharacterized protein LOC119691497 [Plutella xylostella]